MRSLRYFVLALAVLSLAPIFGAPLTIDLSDDPSLLPFFQAGLRPKNMLGVEHLECWLPRGPEIALRIAGVELPIVSGEVHFFLDDKDRLIRLNVYERKNITMEQADELANRFHHAVGASLDQWTHFVAEWRAKNGASTFRLAQRLNKEVLAGYFLIFSFNDSAPFQLVAEIEWQRPLSDWKPRNIPISAPRGFESWIMTPNLKEYADGFTSPDGTSRKQTTLAIPQDNSIVKNPTHSNAIRDSQNTSQPPASGGQVLLLVVIAATVGAVWVFLRKSK